MKSVDDNLKHRQKLPQNIFNGARKCPKYQITIDLITQIINLSFNRFMDIRDVSVENSFRCGDIFDTWR